MLGWMRGRIWLRKGVCAVPARKLPQISVDIWQPSVSVCLSLCTVCGGGGAADSWVNMNVGLFFSMILGYLHLGKMPLRAVFTPTVHFLE